MTFSVLICSTRSFKDVFPSSELKKKKDQKFFPFLSFFLIFVSFLFFSLRKTLICTAVCVCSTVFFFSLSLNLHVCDFSVDRYLIYFSFFFFLFHTIFETYFRFDSTSTKQIYIYSRERRRVSASTCGEITLLGFSKYRS